jgi:sugar lactone lactonase YvrE
VSLAALAAPAAADVLSADRMIWTRHGAQIVDGPVDQASLTKPLALVGAGGGRRSYYLTDIGSNVVRFFDGPRGRIDTIAGDGTKGYAGDGGPYAKARFAWPIALARDAHSVIYISDFDNQRIRVLNPTRHAVTVATVRIGPGTIETIAGNGRLTNPDFSDPPESPPEGVPARQTTMMWPRGLAVDSAGDVFYCDIDNLRVRVVYNKGPKAGTVETYAGSGFPADFRDGLYPGDHGDGGAARDLVLRSPSAVTVGPRGDLYIAEWSRNADSGEPTGVVWRIDHRDRTAHRVAGSGVAGSGGDGGPARDAGLHGNIQSLVFDPRGNLYISDGPAIRRVDRRTQVITTYAGRDEDFIPTSSAADLGRPAVGTTITEMAGMAWDDGELTFVDQGSGELRRVDTRGVLRGAIRARSGIKQPFAAAIDSADRLFVTEWAHGRVRRVDPDGSLATVVNLPDVAGGDVAGPALRARSGTSNGVAFDERGDLYLTDVSSSRVLQVRALPGPGGRLIRPASPIREIARFAPPFEAIADHIAAHAGKVYVGDPISASLIEIDVASGSRRTLAGGDGSFGDISGLVVDARRGRIYAEDPANHRIVAVDLRSGAVSPVADLPYLLDFANTHLALLGDLLFVSNDFVTSQVHVIDTAAAHPVAEPYAGAPQFAWGVFGDGGPARAAGLAVAEGLAFDSAGKLLIADKDSGRIRVVGTSDIKPGAFPNVISRRSAAPVRVAIESNPSFDARLLVPSTVTVAGARTFAARLQDPNDDGRLDLVVSVRQRDLARGLASGAREAPIAGRTRDGRRFADADWATVAG